MLMCALVAVAVQATPGELSGDTCGSSPGFPGIWAIPRCYPGDTLLVEISEHSRVACKTDTIGNWKVLHKDGEITAKEKEDVDKYFEGLRKQNRQMQKPLNWTYEKSYRASQHEFEVERQGAIYTRKFKRCFVRRAIPCDGGDTKKPWELTDETESGDSPKSKK